MRELLTGFVSYTTRIKYYKDNMGLTGIDRKDNR